MSFWSVGKGLQYWLKDWGSRRLMFYILVCLLVFCCSEFWIRRFCLFDVCELYVTWLIFWGSRFAYVVSCVWIINIIETLHQCSIRMSSLECNGCTRWGNWSGLAETHFIFHTKWKECCYKGWPEFDKD